MKYLLMTVLCSLIFTVNFAQNERMKMESAQHKAAAVDLDKSLKTNSQILVNYLTKELKLDDKQKVVVEKAFYNYGRNVSRARHKMNLLRQKEAESKKAAQKEGNEKREFEQKKQMNNNKYLVIFYNLYIHQNVP